MIGPFLIFNAKEQRLSIDVRLPPNLRACSWPGRTFHLHRPGSDVTLCGKPGVRRRREHDSDHAGTPWLAMCGWCLEELPKKGRRL